MASKRRLRRNGCTGKIRYADGVPAAAHAHRMNAQRGISTLREYRCAWCSGWHVGHWRGRV